MPRVRTLNFSLEEWAGMIERGIFDAITLLKWYINKGTCVYGDEEVYE